MAVSLVEEGRAKVVLKPVKSVAEMTFGSVTPRRQPEDFRELRQAFEEGVAESVAAEDRPAQDS